MAIFNCYVSSPEGMGFLKLGRKQSIGPGSRWILPGTWSSVNGIEDDRSHWIRRGGALLIVERGFSTECDEHSSQPSPMVGIRPGKLPTFNQSRFCDSYPFRPCLQARLHFSSSGAVPGFGIQLDRILLQIYFLYFWVGCISLLLPHKSYKSPVTAPQFFGGY